MKSCSELPALTKLSFLGSVLHLSHSWTSRSLFLILPIFWSCFLKQFLSSLSSAVCWWSCWWYLQMTCFGLHSCLTSWKRNLQSYANVTTVFCKEMDKRLACEISFAEDAWVPYKADRRGFKAWMEMFKRWLYLMVNFWKYEAFLCYLALNQVTLK